MSHLPREVISFLCTLSSQLSTIIHYSAIAPLYFPPWRLMLWTLFSMPPTSLKGYLRRSRAKDWICTVVVRLLLHFFSFLKVDCSSGAFSFTSDLKITHRHLRQPPPSTIGKVRQDVTRRGGKETSPMTDGRGTGMTTRGEIDLAFDTTGGCFQVSVTRNGRWRTCTMVVLRAHPPKTVHFLISLVFY